MLSEKEMINQIADAFTKLEEKDERVSKIYSSNLIDNIMAAAKSIDALDIPYKLGDCNMVWGAYIIPDASVPKNIIRVRSDSGYFFDFKIKESD